MTDEELIAKMRGADPWTAPYFANEALSFAADRIEALLAVTVGVKPLVFEGRNGFWRADDGIGGFYEVTEVYSAFHMCRIVVGVANKLIPYNSKDAAFGAANVEHQRRIRAALEHAAPDPAAIRDAALEIWKHANSRDPDDPVFIAALRAIRERADG